MLPQKQSIDAEFPSAFQFLFRPSRFKVAWGGRGSGKSHNCGKALAILANKFPIKVLCAREYQVSIKDSVYPLLKSQVEKLGLTKRFKFTDVSIKSQAGAEFIFKGLNNRPDQTLKSLEGTDICWVEEAHGVTEASWKYLIPTIRSEGRFPWLPQSEIWITMNQHDDTDPSYERFVKNPPPNATVVPVTWEDNPYFPNVLDEERRYMLATDPEAYDWIWGLQTRRLGSSIVFKGHYVVHAFNDPEVRPDRIFFGMDFGFAADPSAAARSYITREADGNHLWISHEAYAHGVELDDLHKLILGGKDRNGTTWPALPNAEELWPVKGDNSRPETISHLRGKGLNITAADKWPGSVEDGIAHLKSFVKIHIHERCKNFATEARLYSYKVDRKSGDVLPVIADKHNHLWDQERYALDGYITSSGSMGTWQRLARQAA